jgi:guanylate kinase
LTDSRTKKSIQPEKPGRIVIISSPSGGGKSSICRRLLSPSRKAHGWQFSISSTTRQRRKGERDGREYCFVSNEAFDRKAAKDYFAEHFRVHLYQYGTPRRPLEQVRKKGGVMLLDVDVQGAQRLWKEYPEAITIFVLPPSVAELRRRLKTRGTETAEQFRVRSRNAVDEMRLYSEFAYTVVNKDLDQAVREVLAIIGSHHCRTENVDVEQMRKITG